MTWILADDEMFYCIDYDKNNFPYILERFYGKNYQADIDFVRLNPIFKTKPEANKYLRELMALRKKYKRGR